MSWYRPRDWEREILLDLLGRRCADCGRTTDLELDHKQALCLGGKNQYSNLQVLCEDCHREKSIRDLKVLYKLRRAERRKIKELARQRNRAVLEAHPREHPIGFVSSSGHSQ